MEGIRGRAAGSRQSAEEETPGSGIQVRLWGGGDVCPEGEWELSRCRRASELRTLPPKLISGKNRP